MVSPWEWWKEKYLYRSSSRLAPGEKQRRILSEVFWQALLNSCSETTVPPSLLHSCLFLLYRLQGQNNDVPSFSCSKKWPCDTILTTRLWVEGCGRVLEKPWLCWQESGKCPPAEWTGDEKSVTARGQKVHTQRMAEWKERRSLDLENIASPLNKVYTAYFWTPCYMKGNKLYLKSKWYKCLSLYVCSTAECNSVPPWYKRSQRAFAQVFLLKSFIYFPWNISAASKTPAGASAPLKSFLLILFSSFSHGPETQGNLRSPRHPSEPTGPILWVPMAVL